MKVLVTGASGFIGREIVSELKSQNFEVISLSRSTTAETDGEAMLNADITNAESVAALRNLRDVEVVIHSAGLAHQFGETRKEEFDAVNVVGAANVTNLAVELKAKQFILIASTAIYGNHNSVTESDSESEPKGNFQAISEETPPKPPTLYAESKLEGENVCRKICEDNEIALTIFRLAPVIGEDNAGNVARLIEAIDKKRFVWIGDGRNLKSLIYKKDVARACVKVIEAKKNGTEIFNLSAEPIVLKNFVEMIEANLNRKILPVKIPAFLPRAVFKLNGKLLRNKKISKIAETVEKWLADDVYSGDKIKAVYGFQAQTPIAEAIARQVADYRRNKK